MYINERELVGWVGIRMGIISNCFGDEQIIERDVSVEVLWTGGGHTSIRFIVFKRFMWNIVHYSIAHKVLISIIGVVQLVCADHAVPVKIH